MTQESVAASVATGSPECYSKKANRRGPGRYVKGLVKLSEGWGLRHLAVQGRDVNQSPLWSGLGFRAFPSYLARTRPALQGDSEVTGGLGFFPSYRFRI